MFSHLIIPLDGSTIAEEVLHTAQEISRKFESTITLVHVLVNIPHASLVESESHDNLLDTIRREAYEAAVAYLGKIGQQLRNNGHEQVYQHLVEHSDPAVAIVEATNAVSGDAIIMSTHGRTGLSRWVYGSIAEKVLRSSPVPVILIRAKNLDNSA